MTLEPRFAGANSALSATSLKHFLDDAAATDGERPADVVVNLRVGVIAEAMEDRRVDADAAGGGAALE